MTGRQGRAVDLDAIGSGIDPDGIFGNDLAIDGDAKLFDELIAGTARADASLGEGFV